MVGQIDKKDKITRALEVYILKDREKQRLEDEAEAEKMRKKKEVEEKKSKEESEYKATKDKLADMIKRYEQLQQDKTKLFEHLKKIISDPSKNTLQSDDVSKLLNIGLAVSHLTPPPAPAPPVHPTTVPVTVIPRVTTVSINSQYKATTTTTMPVQVIPTQKRNRSPSPTVYRSAYGYKQAAGPHPFQKLEDPHRNHDYNRSYLYKPGNAPPSSSSYNAFYPPGQTVAYTHPSATVHGNATVYSYGSNRDSIEVLHKSQPVPPPPTPPQHSSLYAHRSPMPPGPSPIQSANHVSYLVDPTKSSQSYPDDKYYIVRPGNHVPVHGGVIPIQQPPSVNKHGSITAGYPVRPVATQMGPQAQIHVQPSHGAHHSSQPSHHGSQAAHHPSQSSHHSQASHHSSQSSHHSSQPSHHSSLSHHSPQAHHPSSQSSQIRLPQSHHQQSSVHYPSSSQLHHSQSHGSSQPQQSHAPPQPPVSVPSHHSAPHHQHIQQLHVQSHHPQVSSHHQLMGHHTPSSIHHTSSQHLQQAMHHQQALQQSQSLHPSHSQSLHHQAMSQPHIQQHISHQSQSQGQQSQPTSVVTSQAYANQIGAIQGGSRVVYSQPNIPH